ncbi:MAG: phage shock protein operon transcriptional activator [Desulfofustis sp.]|jgi:psp operon transcriptional activator|nr:phage shock protein operon transcriptional activator [Desulfofustis sp.]
MSYQPREEALGQSEPFLDFQDQLSRVATVNRPVLLLGERGTGKELAARRLHFLSDRWEGPFVTLNCATLSPTLIESELFGHERGAYTGAETLRIGRFEAASGGTLFLDEIGTIPMQAQEKILRVVEYYSFERVGSSEPIEVDVRIICATNADLPAMARQGAFKQDLLDRLSFEVLFLPPLRHRGEDIMLLAEHFGSRMRYELGIDEPLRFSAGAVRSLEAHRWEGNVRELKNVVERAVYRAGSGTIDEIDFDPFDSPYFPRQRLPAGDENGPETGPGVGTSDLTAGFKELVATYEQGLINQALEATRYNQKRSAELLGLTYDQFRGLLRKYGI